MHMMFGVIIEKQVLVFKEVSGGFQGSTEVWDASHGVRGGLGLFHCHVTAVENSSAVEVCENDTEPCYFDLFVIVS